MGKGEIEEQGNPAELKMREHGSYAKLLHKDKARRS
jgi:ABC-type multidrug transport system fused ATPase/permease subunit